jgi:hypothetical protein
VARLVGPYALACPTGPDEPTRANRHAGRLAPVSYRHHGAGLDLETRLEIVREIFLTSDKTTVHMKDFASGPDGFLPFVRSVLTGLADYQG